jgi:hypothetical protein
VTRDKSNRLRERAEAVKSGKEVFIDWELVKKQLREKLRGPKIRLE